MDIIGLIGGFSSDTGLAIRDNQPYFTYSRIYAKFPDKYSTSESNPRMSFIVKDYKHTDNLLLKVCFNHNVAYVAYHINNMSSSYH